MKRHSIFVLAVLVAALISGHSPAQGADTTTNSWQLVAQQNTEQRPARNDQQRPPQNNQRQPKGNQRRSPRNSEPIQRQR